MLSDGYIEYLDLNSGENGWYDYFGNKIFVPNGYWLMDVKDNKIILRDSYNQYIIDMNGNILMEAEEIKIYDNQYVIKKANGKYVLVDKDIKNISREYDEIIADEARYIFNEDIIEF